MNTNFQNEYMNDPRYSRFHYLLDGYINDKLTHDEIDEFFGFLRDDFFIGNLDQVVDHAFLSKEFSGLSDKIAYDRKFKELMTLVSSLQSGQEKSSGQLMVSPKSRIFKYWQYAAAAVILILITTSVYLFTLERKQSPLKVAEQIDLEPGGNRAFLTLSNGNIILLDSAANGILAEEEGATVKKVADGRLEYLLKKDIKKEKLFNIITTPRAGQYNLVLPDGSQVWLNSESSIKFPVSFVDKIRMVEITGEAYFEVAKNPEMPFRVVTGNTTIEVLGTSFNIKSYSNDDSIYTTLIEGSVQIASQAARLSLTPGQQAVTDQLGIITVNNDADISEITAWKNGLFIFNSEPIESIMAQIARWYNVDVDFDGPGSRETFSGIVSRKSNVSDVLKIMQQAGVMFTVTSEKITVTTE